MHHIAFGVYTVNIGGYFKMKKTTQIKVPGVLFLIIGFPVKVTVSVIFEVIQVCS